MDLEDELFALRFLWSEMMGNTALENSPDEMARLGLGACVKQHTLVTPKGKDRRVDIECGFARRVGSFHSQAFLGTQWSEVWEQSDKRHGT